MTRDLDSFRRETRAWLEENCPPSMRTPMPEDEVPWGGRRPVFKNPDSRVWLERMAGRGWTVPTWPTDYGGGGLSALEALVLSEEMARINARIPLFSLGIMMLGPVLLEFGTEVQKREHVPKIARGEIWWSQGYSEPGSGSDLASLQTYAEDRGDHFLVNGQKVWTSHADKSDWIFCLVRTDRSARKHDGISFLVFDMTTPGVSTRPIRLISGASPFCETFFTDVKVPKDAVLGRINAGWTVAKRLLQFERHNIASVGFEQAGGLDLVAAAKGEGAAIADPDLRARVADHEMRTHALALTVKRAARAADDGPSATTSVIKYAAARLNQDKHELIVEAMGLEGLGWAGDAFAREHLIETRAWLRSKANSIEGGTSEINLNVIAKRVLGLPEHN